MTPTPPPPPSPLPVAIPFAQPFLDIDDRRAVKRVLDSKWLTTGREARAFEEEFARYVGARHAVAVSSCTAALHLSLVLAGVGPGDAVVVPTLTFTATAAAAVEAGATPVLADVDPETLTLTAETMDRVMNPLVRAVIPVHYGGNPSGFSDVVSEARHLEIDVVDDAAHALPSWTDGEKVGSERHGVFATCFSFYPTKPLTTAEGGMLVLRDADAVARARRLSLHGIDADAYQRSRQGLYHYEVVEHGWKYNLPDLLAALGRSQLAKSDALARRRAFIAEAYGRRFRRLVTEDAVVRLPVVLDGSTSSWHLYVIQFELERLHSGWDRDRIAAAMRDAGIGTSIHYRPLHRHRYWQERCSAQLSGGDPALLFPSTERAYPRMLSLPIWPGMTDADIDRVVGTLEKILGEATI